jgi:hypothetical protein
MLGRWVGLEGRGVIVTGAAQVGDRGQGLRRRQRARLAVDLRRMAFGVVETLAGSPHRR